MIVNRPQIIKNETAFSHRAEAAGSTLNSAYTNLVISGYYSEGDGGGARYRRVTPEPGHAGKFQSADGVGWWELAERATPKMLGAKGDDSTDDGPSFQTFLDYNEDRVSQNFIPLSRTERYYIGSRLTSVEPDLSIIGDVGPARQTTPHGYITGPATGIDCLLDWGNGTSMATGALHLEKLRFYRSSAADYPAIRVTNDSNGPSRGVTIRDVSCRGFTAMIELETPTATEGWIACANLVLDNCNVLGCTYSVHAIDRVLGVRISGNQLEQGAKIHGLLDGPVTIVDNMLEGQDDAIRIFDVSRCHFYLARNYFEVQTGDYAVSFEAENRDSEIVVDHNYGWFQSTNTCTDLIRLVGQSKLRFLPDSLLLANNRAQLFSLMNWDGYMADFNGQGFLAYGDVQNTFFAPCNPRYMGRSTTGWTVTNNIAAVTVATPIGTTTTARSETGFAATYDAVAETPDTGDLVVMCALVKVDEHTSLEAAWAPTTSYTVTTSVVSHGGVNWIAASTHTSGADFETDWIAGKWFEQNSIPEIRLYNSTASASIRMTAGIEWPNDADGQWLLFVSATPCTFTEATNLQLRFGASTTSLTSNHTITIASVATKVVAAANFDSEGRVSIDHLIPPIA